MVENMHQGCNIPSRLFQVPSRTSNPRMASSPLILEHPSASFFCHETSCLVEVILQLPGRRHRYVYRDSHPISQVSQQGSHTYTRDAPPVRGVIPWQDTIRCDFFIPNLLSSINPYSYFSHFLYLYVSLKTLTWMLFKGNKYMNRQ